jgi:exodeoxyribonuclease VII small subunit
MAKFSPRAVSRFTPLSPRYMPKAATSLSSTAPDKDAVPPSYEAAVQELETLVHQLESGQMPLDQILTGYQRGAVLLAYCGDRLAVVEQQIEVLDKGVLKPWKPE